jgi:hypothetical protein
MAAPPTTSSIAMAGKVKVRKRFITMYIMISANFNSEAVEAS